jgi:hypothetical protein
VRTLPAATHEFLKRMLAIDPKLRPPMLEVAARLADTIAGGVVASAMPRRLLLAGGLAAIAGALGAGALTGQRGKHVRALFGVKWEITSDQPRTEIRSEDGLLLGYTPWHIDPLRELEKDGTPDPLSLTVYLPGFEEQTLSLSLYEDAKRHLQLTPVSWRITSEPSGACVIGPGGHELGRTPWTSRSDGRRSNLRVKLTLDGYAPTILTLSSQHSQVQEVRLKAVPVPAQPPSVAPHGRGVQPKPLRTPIRPPTRVPAEAPDAQPMAKVFEI